MNIFVTVGTAEMDELIKAIDRQIGAALIKGNVVAQIGRGKYRPKNMRYFHLVTPEVMQKGHDWADLVINTGGMGTIGDTVIKRKKKMICVWMRPWSSQLIKPWVNGGHILYTDNLEELPLLIQQATTYDFKPYEAKGFEIGKNEILKLLGELKE